MADPKRILIVGGGYTGLVAAWRLCRQPDVEVTLVERSPELGGLAAGFPLLGTSLEKAYHHLFMGDTAIRGLIQELGLGDKLQWWESSVGISLGGRIYPFGSPLDLLRFSPCSLLGRVRFGLATLYLQKKKNWRPLARQTAQAWMARVCGREVMRTIWNPLLKGKFDRYAGSVSMAWLWARIHVRVNSRPRGGGKEKLGYIRGGFAELTRKLEAELTRGGVHILTGTPVQRLETSVPRRAVLSDGRALPFDLCLFTGPSNRMVSLLPPATLPPDYVRRIESIEYLAAVCLVFVSDQSIADQYWLNIHEEDAPFLLFVQHTRLVGTEDYQGRHVYYIGSYQPQESPLLAMSDDALAEKWFSYLRRIYPHFNPDRVQERHVFRFAAAQHIADTRYEEKMPDHRTPVPGLYLANFSQIFPEDRGTNYAVQAGNKVADLILEDLRGAESSRRAVP